MSSQVLAAPVRIEDAYLPLVALAKYAGLSVRTLRSYLTHSAHPLPHYRVGGKVLVKRSEFDDWMATFRGQTASSVDVLVDDVLRGL
jgi:excisionase family DNA binding protein